MTSLSNKEKASETTKVKSPTNKQTNPTAQTQTTPSKRKSHQNKLIEQIPKPYLLLGDLNNHSTVWGCQKTNKKGKDVKKVINTNNLCILNNKSNTCLNPPTGSYSAIDLSLCDLVSYMDYV